MLWSIITGILIVLSLFLLALIISYLCTDDMNLPKCDISWNDLQSGDIIAIGGVKGLLFTASSWGHVAVIQRINNEIKVVEMCAYNREKKHVLCMNIDEWRKYNKNQNVAVLRINKSFTIDNCNKYSNFKLDKFGLHWFKYLKFHPYNVNEESKYITCASFIMHILQDCNIAQKILSPKSYNPGDIIHGNFLLNEGYEYSGPYLLGKA